MTVRLVPSHLLVAGLTIVLCSGFGPRSVPVVNLGVGSPGEMNESFLAFRRLESKIPADLNGDGDIQDAVVGVYHLPTGQIFNLALAAGEFMFESVYDSKHLDGNWFAMGVSESFQGYTDLNGDGDIWDDVLHVVDLSSGRIVNVGVATALIQVENNLVLFRVFEGNEGRDLNGDGDTGDYVLHSYDPVTENLTNWNIACESSSRRDVITERLVTFAVSEASQGGSDLNGDGDGEDIVYHVFDFETCELTNLRYQGEGYATLAVGSGPRIALRVSESAERRDLNGDGVRSAVLVLYDIRDQSAAALSPNL